MKDDLTVDEEFATRLRALTDYETETLERQLIEKGCLDKIKVWANHRDTIVDGHNRYRICKKHGIKFSVQPLTFASREEVLAYIDETNSGRRNLTALEQSVIRGRRYNAEKAELGTNQHAKSGFITVINPGPTCERLAGEFNVGVATIVRDASFATAIDQIKQKAGDDVVRQILTEEVDMTRKQITALASKPKEEIVQKVEEFKTGQKQEPKQKKETSRDTSWPAMLRWAAKRKKPVTKDDLAEHFEVIETDCRKRLATACQTTSSRFMVMDLGDGNYRVVSAAMVQIDGEDKCFADLWKEIRMMAEYGLKQIHASESGGWSREHQMKFVGSVLAMAKEYTGG